MPFAKGNNANPNGRPKKGRSVAEVYRDLLETPRYALQQEYIELRRVNAKASVKAGGKLTIKETETRKTSYIREQAMRFLFEIHSIGSQPTVDEKGNAIYSAEEIGQRLAMLEKIMNRAYGVPGFAQAGPEPEPPQLVAESVDELFAPLENMKRVTKS